MIPKRTHQSSIISVLLALGLICAPVAAQERKTVSEGLASRTGHGLKPDGPSGIFQAPSFPPGISLSERLSEDAAVAIALWNNAALEASLGDLGLARSDLVEAGLLRNLNLQVLLPIGPKPFEFALQAPIEAIWQRPRRVAAARLNLEQVSSALVQNGLDLARDVRLAYADLGLAEQKAQIARESSGLRARIAELTELRYKAGDISEMEALAVRSEARSFEEQAVLLEREVDTARERLRLLMGLRRDETSFHAAPGPVEAPHSAAWKGLMEAAMSSRPDLRAAELSIQAAAERARWERSRIMALVAPILSIKEVGTSGVRVGPGISVDLPLFNRNQGAVSRADVEVVRATLRYGALLDRIELEVREARLQLERALVSLGKIRDEVLPGVEEVIRLAERAYTVGDASYLYWLEASRQIYDVRSREAEALAALRRARAQLEHSIGRKP